MYYFRFTRDPCKDRNKLNPCFFFAADFGDFTAPAANTAPPAANDFDFGNFDAAPVMNTTSTTPVEEESSPSKKSKV